MNRRPRLRSTGVSGELIQQLNTSWRIAGPDGAGPARASLKQRLASPFRRVLTRLLGTQETFNAMVVQYVNADQRRLDVLDEALDTLDAAVDDARRHQEALAARERRMDEAMRAMRAEHEEIRAALSVLRTRSAENPKSQIPNPNLKSPTTNHLTESQATDHKSQIALGGSYVGFEDLFRGSAEAIAANLASYVPIFAGASDVLDIGCGRGEFLELLRAAGVGARGIDLNASMVEVCREKGLAADTADALGFLQAQPDGSLGGLFAAQVVEHLEPAYLTQLLDAASLKLRAGAPIVLETINPACWFAFFESYVRDITHVRPLHPDTLRFLLVAGGFQRVDIQFRAPYPEHEKLRPVHGLPADAAETINGNMSKLNSLLFTHLDYAAVAYKP